MFTTTRFSQLRRFYKLLDFKPLQKFSNIKENGPIQTNYKSPVVEERFYKKPTPKYSLGEILRIEHIVKNYENYYDKEGIIAGWARTVRYERGENFI